VKICLACSIGGHMVQIRKLDSLYSQHEYFFVTFFSEPVKELINKEKFYFIKDPGRNAFNFILNIAQSLKIFVKEKPDLVISTGAGVAIAMCLWARVFGRKVIFIEDWCVVNKPSISGRIMYHFANLFIIQWEELKRFYPKAKFGGSLL
jgi:beta-1,4-N-acetylglucosaminyltransferase